MARLLKTSLAATVVAFVVFAGFSPTVFAYAVGNAASCSSLAVCNYSISNSSGSGFAQASAGICCYVGQNFTFYGGSLTFALPGESVTSHDAGVYRGTAINTKVFTTTAGLIYHVTGTFAAADYSTGMIVRGSTNGYVGIIGHSGRGGGISYVLVNGTISFKHTNFHATMLSVTCNPTSLMYGKYTTCNATVTDLLGSSTSVPAGYVTFSSTSGFSPKKCTLSSGGCSVKIFPYGGTWPVYATYSGDGSHYKSSAQGPELYVSCPSGGC